MHAARPHLLRILGPNCLGLLSPPIGLHASFAHIMGKGTQRMTAMVLRENKAIRELAVRCGFQVDGVDLHGTSFRYVLDLGAP